MAKKRVVLKLKKEYENKIVTVQIPKIGSVSFDTSKVMPNEYKNYVANGFGHCFDEVEQEDISDDLRVELKANELGKQKEAEAEKEADDEDENENEADEAEKENLKVNETAKAKPTPKKRGTRTVK